MLKCLKSKIHLILTLDHSEKENHLVSVIKTGRFYNNLNCIFCIFKALRIEEVQGIRAKFPNKVPVIVERFHKERNLAQLDKTKFLVPQELTMSQFVTIIRFVFLPKN